MVAAGGDGVDGAVDPGRRPGQVRRAAAGAGVRPTPANVSAPVALLTTKARQAPTWWAARMLTQKAPARAIRGREAELRATLKPTSGGSGDSEENDWQAEPTGVPSSVTPVQKCPSTERSRPPLATWGTAAVTAGSGMRSSGPTARSAGYESDDSGAELARG